MQNGVLVSIVIPICNAENYLRCSLESVLKQTVNEVEVICVDDGSTDGSAAILEEYVAKDGRIKVVTQENSGQGAARNRGMDVATGDYVYFLDADDELGVPETFERLLAAMERERLDVLFFDAETVYDEGMECVDVVKREDYIRRHDYSSVYTGRELFARFWDNQEYSPSPCLAIYRRSFLEENNIRFPQERIFYEDNIFMTRVLLTAKRASHRPWRLYLRKVHAGSTVTSKATMRHLRGYLCCYRNVCEMLACEQWGGRMRRVLVGRRVEYKLHVRRIADSYPDLVDAAINEMPSEEYEELCKVLVYPFGEKIVNAFRCWRAHGFRYTLRRIFFGRQR